MATQKARYLARKSEAGLKRKEVWVSNNALSQCQGKKGGLVFLEKENMQNTSVILRDDNLISLVSPDGIVRSGKIVFDDNKNPVYCHVPLKVNVQISIDGQNGIGKKFEIVPVNDNNQKKQNNELEQQSCIIDDIPSHSEIEPKQHPALEQINLMGLFSFVVAVHEPGGEFKSYTYNPKLLKKNLLKLAKWNAEGKNIYICPSLSYPLVMINNISTRDASRMTEDGFEPACVIEISPGHYQCWLKLAELYDVDILNKFIHWLSRRYNGDFKTARFGQHGALAGFFNYTPKYHHNGKAPMCKLLAHSGKTVTIDQHLLQLINYPNSGDYQSDEHFLWAIEFRNIFEKWKLKRKRHKRVVNPEHGDFYVCCELFRMGWTRENVEIALKGGSSSLSGKRDALGYIHRTVASAMMEVQKEKI